ncbi:MAG: AEC family transporter, partial [Desulfovibrionaceae bacterium]|nr:AEC family transporter [Desulfovibrionaceae bacterium]
LDKAVAMIGYVSPPCMLFTLGLTLRGNLTRALQSHAISMGHQLWLWFWRLIGIPLVTLGALLLLGVDPLWVSVSTIVSATGTAIFVAAMAQLYQTAPGSAALTVAVTNLLSLFSLMGALALLTWMGCMPPHFSL